jgi:hypothetical protein
MAKNDIQHLDEAPYYLIASLKERWSEFACDRILIIEDAFGRFTFGVWGKNQSIKAIQTLLDAIEPFGSDSWFRAPDTDSEFDPVDLRSSWDGAVCIDTDGNWDDRIRLIVRFRMLPAWQHIEKAPLSRAWTDSICPVIAFYSFKGGMGRSTALALFALDRIRQNEHVVVVDLDLDAPGLGTILKADATAPYGVVDYLIETPVLGHRPEDLSDYYYTLDLGSLPSTGSLKVFPSGTLNGDYLGKMARLDFESVDPTMSAAKHPLFELLEHIKETLHPDWILLDSRTGFSETAGMVLSGMCDYHVLFGVQSEQSWQGLSYAIGKLGADRVIRGLAQAETMLVHSMVPDVVKDQRDRYIAQYAEKSREVFEARYYSEVEIPRDDTFWYLDDSGGETAPDRPFMLLYRAVFSQSVSVADLLDSLESSSEIRRFCDELAIRSRDSMTSGSI